MPVTGKIKLRFVLVPIAILAVSILAGFGLYQSGSFRLNHPDPARFPVLGVDVSHHQREIDWKRVQAEGIRFAFLKATEGKSHRDRQFTRNWEEASKVGIARGAYHFFTFCAPGLEQANHFLATVGNSWGELPPVADVEFSGNCQGWKGIAEIRQELSVFLEHIEVSTGRRPILYFTDKSFKEILAGPFDRYPRWSRSIAGEPTMKPWLFWQFADNASMPGIKTLVDLNVFHGSADEFSQLLQR